VSLPYQVLPESNKLFQDVLNKVIEDTKITEPFYMRHIFANDDTPDHVSRNFYFLSAMFAGI